MPRGLGARRARRGSTIAAPVVIPLGRARLGRDADLDQGRTADLCCNMKAEAVAQRLSLIGVEIVHVLKVGTLGFGAMRLMLCNAAIKISTCAADR